MTTREASCPCGALRTRCLGEPVRISICHCLACKRRSGSAFSYNATYPAASVELLGERRLFERVGDEGRWGRFSFCPTCGGTVWYQIEARPGMISVPVGAFADPGFPEPRVSVYEERRHAWVELRTEAPIERWD